MKKHAVKRNLHDLNTATRAKAAAERKHKAAVKRVVADGRAVKAKNEKQIAALKAENAAVDSVVAGFVAGGPRPGNVRAAASRGKAAKKATKKAAKKSVKKAAKKKPAKKSGKKAAKKKTAKKSGK